MNNLALLHPALPIALNQYRQAATLINYETPLQTFTGVRHCVDGLLRM
jgi:hypothetical protein